MIPYYAPQFPGYLDTFVPQSSTVQDASAWMPTLNALRGQRGYLENLLAKAATKINALRDKQMRNERIASANPEYPRAKRKKISQNQWRTNKTIKTCENEEKVILECLQVCRCNIDTLESLLYPAGCPPGIVDLNSPNSYAGSDFSGVQWTSGWTDDDEPISPFVPSRGGPIVYRDVAPNHRFSQGLLLPDYEHKYPSSLVPDLKAGSTLLSAQAPTFIPSFNDRQPKDGGITRIIDKLSISGLLSSNCMKQHLATQTFLGKAKEHSTNYNYNGAHFGSMIDAYHNHSISGMKGKQHSMNTAATAVLKRLNSV